MAIVAEDIDKLRDNVDMIAIVSEHVALRRVGTRFVGRCPFHDEKTGSFNVNPDRRYYHCFGCQAHGSAIDFVMNIERVDFVSACEKIAAKLGFTLRQDSEGANRDRQRKQRLRSAMTSAVEWYHDRLLTAADAGPARSYLRSRGYDAEVVKAFKIGWAPAGWDLLTKQLGLSTDVAKDTGLGYVNRTGKLNDFFQTRILFPIFDANGDPIAFGGRKMPEADGPKYKNSSETALYSKSKVLYGLNWAKSDIVKSGEVIVCEGYTDTIAFHRADMPRAVATCGTALTEDHVRILKNYGRRIVLAYDADGAGQSAAARFYEWEKKFELDLVVVSLPDGADPADLARTDPEALRTAVSEAKPFLEFRLERMYATANLKTAEGRARAFEAAADMVAEHPSALVREDYLRQAADRCRVSEELMASALQRRSQPSSRPRRTVVSNAPDDVPPPDDRFAPRSDWQRSDFQRSDRQWSDRQRPGSPGRVASPGSQRVRSTSVSLQADATRRAKGVEVSALCWLIHSPDEVAVWLHPGLFADPVMARCCEALVVHGDLLHAIDALQGDDDFDGEQTLSALAATDPTGEPQDSVARLVRSAATRALDDLLAGDEDTNADPASLVAAVSSLKQHMSCLDEPDERVSSLTVLVPWLVARYEHQ
jgi:DNA primase